MGRRVPRLLGACKCAPAGMPRLGTACWAQPRLCTASCGGQRALLARDGSGVSLLAAQVLAGVQWAAAGVLEACRAAIPAGGQKPCSPLRALAPPCACPWSHVSLFALLADLPILPGFPALAPGRRYGRRGGGARRARAPGGLRVAPIQLFRHEHAPLCRLRLAPTHFVHPERPAHFPRSLFLCAQPAPGPGCASPP